MANAQSRITETKRIYEGEETGERLVNWLNHTNHADEKERILRVIALYSDLRDHHFSMKRPKYTRIGDDEWKEHQTPETKRRNELQLLLDEALGFYQTTPWVLMHRRLGKRGEDRGFSVHVGSRPVDGSELDQSLKNNSDRRSLSEIERQPMEADFLPGARMNETGAIRRVLELIQTDYISKVRRCRCERFFFQRFAHQRFCSEKCRIAEFRTSDEARQKRNAYARKLYKLHKTKNVK